MARIATSGGEIRDHPTSSIGSPDGYSGGAAATTTETTTKRSGGAAIKCPGTSTSTAYRIFPFTAPAAGTYLYSRFYVRLSALPAATKVIARFSAGATNISSVKLTSAGKFQLWRDVATAVQYGSDSADTLAVDRWYRLEFMQKIGAGATDEFELRVATDEALPPDYPSVVVASVTGQTVTDTQPTELRIGWVEDPDTTSDMFLDDIAVNDSTGTKQTSWPGEASVGLIPAQIVSGSVGNWTDCGGVADGSDIGAGLGNIPPLGHVDTVHSDSQERHQSWCASGSSSPVSLLCRSYARAGAPGNFFVDVTTETQWQTAWSSVHQARAFAFFFNGSLAAFEFYGKRVGDGLSGGNPIEFTVEVRTDSTDRPSATVLGSTTFELPDLSTSEAWVPLAFSTAIPCSPNQRYWLAMKRSDDSFNGTTYLSWSGASYLPFDRDFGWVSTWNGSVWSVPGTATGKMKLYADGAQPVPVLTAVCCHGEAVSTGTKTGTLELTENPVMSSMTFNYGDNAGAAGAYPSNWRWAAKTAYDVPLTNSNVALSPIAKIAKTDTGTRTADVCFVGVQVEYTPPLSPGWVQYTKTSDSSLWWAKLCTSTTTYPQGVLGADPPVVVQAGDYAMHADPMPADEADMGTVTSVTRPTLDSDYTIV